MHITILQNGDIIAHDLHKAVAEAICQILDGRYTLELDDACEFRTGVTKKQLPFFLADQYNIIDRSTAISKVDLFIKKEEKIKLVCEIEESGFNPTKIYGKVFSTATAYKCRLKGDKAIDLDDKGIFIQVMSNKHAIKKGSKKLAQGINICNIVNDILSKSNLWIKDYYLIFGDTNSFVKGQQGYSDLESILSKLNIATLRT